MPRVLLGLAVLAITIYAVIDAIQTEDARVQHLPKLVWILLILLFAPIGPIAWSSPEGNAAHRPAAVGRTTRRPHVAPTMIRTFFVTCDCLRNL